MFGIKEVRKSKDRKFYLVILSLLVVCVILLFIPIKLPYSIRAYCRIQPVQKWVLTSGSNGQLSTSIINYKSGTSKGYNISQFAREGSMRLTFKALVDTGSFINAGDTIATIYSSETEENLADLKGQISTLQATLAVDSNGEKESVIREYELRLAQALEAETNQRLILARQKSMLGKNLISQQEYDIVSNKESLLVVEIGIARSQLESARTGAKAEQIELIQTKIDALERRLGALNKRAESFSIISPISGKICRQYSPDTLLVISDITTYVALIPFKLREAAHLTPNLKVRVFADGSKHKIQGRLTFVDKDVYSLSGDQACVATAVIEDNGAELTTGMFGNCIVRCEPVSIPEFIWDFFRNF
jgi:hypothetical protein